jgi:hypothetical protein
MEVKHVTHNKSSPVEGVALQRALNKYGRATQLVTLLAWWPRMLYVLSNGQLGSLRFSARREGKALASAYEVGKLDALASGRDEFSPVMPADTGRVIAETSGDLSAEIDAYMNHIIMRSRISQVGASRRLPARAILATLVVVGIVVVVDWFLNEPLVSRLGLPGYAIHVTSIMIALASLVFAHYVVVGTPPGRRNRTRIALIILAILGFLLFIVPGAYLRTTDAAAAQDTQIVVGTDVPDAETSITTVLSRLIPIGVMLGLMLFTTAVAALIALRNEIRKDELRDDGTSQRMAALRTEAQVSTARALQNKVIPLTRRLISAHTSGFNSVGLQRKIEIAAPEPVPPVGLVATAAAEETVLQDVGSEAQSSGATPRASAATTEAALPSQLGAAVPATAHESVGVQS